MKASFYRHNIASVWISVDEYLTFAIFTPLINHLIIHGRLYELEKVLDYLCGPLCYRRHLEYVDSHGLWLGSTYQALANVWRADMDKYMWIQWVTPLFYTFFFIYIFAKGFEGKGIVEGMRFGLIIWGFVSIPMIYGQFMVYPLPYHLVLKWLFADLLTLLVMGVLTALIYKPGEEKAK